MWLVVGLVAQAARPSFERPSENERLGAIGNLYEEPDFLRELFRPDDDFSPVPLPGHGDWLSYHREPGQTYDAYRGAEPKRPDATRHIIYLQPLGEFPADETPSLELLRDYAARFFQLEVRILPTYFPHDLEFDPRINEQTHKRQRLTRAILGWLHSRIPADGYCLLAVTMDDLYPDPDWNYVFGEASLEDQVGVYSFARYDPAFFNETSGASWQDKALQRAAKVLVHETGHIFGLYHCIYFDCVMNGSNSLEETDAQSPHLCPVCLRKLIYGARFDPVKRYRELKEYYRARRWFEEADWVERQLRRTPPPSLSETSSPQR